MPDLQKPKSPKEIDVFNRFSRFNKLKITLIAFAIAAVIVTVVFFLVKSFTDYTITFVAYGGTVYGEQLGVDEYKFLQKTKEPEGLKKEGYYIAGFYTDSEFKNEFKFGKPIWNSHTIYVDWQPGYAVQLFFVQGEDDADRNQAEKTGINLEYLKMYHEQYVAPNSTYKLPLVYNTIEGNKHNGEQLLWYDNPEAIGDPIETKNFEMTGNIQLYGVWYDTSLSKFDITSDGTLKRYLGNCYNIKLPYKVKRLKSINPNDFMLGLWNTTNVADGTNYSVFDRVMYDLKRVYINEECEELNSCAFKNCEKLKKVVFLGNKISVIGEQAFAYCTNLDSLQLPTTVKTICDRAFYSSGIKSLEGIENVETIGEEAFINCLRLTSVDFAKVNFIGQSAFAGCYSLKSLYLRTSSVVSTNVESNENNILYSSTQTIIYVPKDLVSNYQNTYPWSVYSARIVGITE